MKLYKQPKSGNWSYDFAYKGRRYRGTTGTGRRALAQEIAMDSFQDAVRGVRTNAPIAFHALADEWWKVHGSKLSWSGLEGVLRWWMSRLSGDANAITLRQIETLLSADRKAATWKPSTRNRYLSVLKTIFNKGIAWGLVETNPCVGIKRLKEEARLRYLTREQANELIRLSPESCNFQEFVLMAIHTGMRRGELLNLEWRDVDFTNGVLTVQESKNGEKRFLPLSAVCSTVLWAMLGEASSDDKVFNQLNPGRIRVRFRRALKAAEITDFHVHDLRHTFACLMRLSGVDIQTLKDMLGHKSLLMTQRYANIGPQYVEVGRKFMNSAFPSEEGDSPTVLQFRSAR